MALPAAGPPDARTPRTWRAYPGRVSGENDAPEVVASVGPLDAVVVLLREFRPRAGARRAVAVIGGGRGEDPAVVDVRRLHPTEVEVGGRLVLLPHAIELDPSPPAAMPAVRQMAPFEVDAEAGPIAAPPGAGAPPAPARRGPPGPPRGRHGPAGPPP